MVGTPSHPSKDAVDCFTCQSWFRDCTNQESWVPHRWGSPQHKVAKKCQNVICIEVRFHFGAITIHTNRHSEAHLFNWHVLCPRFSVGFWSLPVLHQCSARYFKLCLSEQERHNVVNVQHRPRLYWNSGASTRVHVFHRQVDIGNLLGTWVCFVFCICTLQTIWICIKGLQEWIFIPISSTVKNPRWLMLNQFITD